LCINTLVDTLLAEYVPAGNRSRFFELAEADTALPRHLVLAKMPREIGNSWLKAARSPIEDGEVSVCEKESDPDAFYTRVPVGSAKMG
jgi:hypothetical protein